MAKKVEKKPSSSTYRIGVTAPTDGLDTMFRNNGFDVVVLPYYHLLSEPAPEIDMIAFTGGVDVSPSLYGSSYHEKTNTGQKLRDESDASYYLTYKDLPKVGVCRGAQFLCVKGGGRLFQHITSEDHQILHKVLDHGTGRFIDVTSVHHQACEIKAEWNLLATASHSSMVERASRFVCDAKYYVPEAFYIPETRSLCVQFHPEYKHQPSELFFLELMQRVFE